jgi:HlyD family secretion protein
MFRKKWWIIGLVVVLAAGSWGGYRYFKKDAKQLTASYATTKVTKGNLEVKISGTGSIQPIARETLKAKTAGTALKVNYKQGDTVKKGDVLITYTQEDISDQVRSKEMNVEKMKLDLTDLQTKYKSAADDTARESIAVSIQKQQLDIKTALADITSLTTSKKIDPILAPIDGVLSSTFTVKAGDSLNPNVDLGEVVDFSQLQMVVGIDELDIPKVKLAQEAQILVEALPKETYTGKVVAIANEGTTTNGVASFNVTINLSTIKNLKVGMSAEASIMTNKKTDVLYVPVDAVQSFQGKYFVMVPSKGTGTSTRTNAPQGGQGQGQGQGGQGQGGQGQGGQGQGGQGQGGQGQAGQGKRSAQFQNMTPEQRAAMRAQRGAGGPNASTGTVTNAASTTRVPVEVGINNEDNIEITSGLKEGDLVILPTVMSTGSKSNTQQGFPGLGGSVIPGGGGGGFPGGGGGGRPGGGGG